MNYAEMIDRAAEGLIKQGAWSILKISPMDTICAYRGENGTACAVGLLITDEEYAEALYASNPTQMPQPYFGEVMQVMDWGDYRDFFADMQHWMHDSNFEKEFSADLVLEGARKMKERYCV